MKDIFNLFSNTKPKKEGEYTHIVSNKPVTEGPAVNTKDSNRISNIIIYSALVFLLTSNIVFFLLFNEYKSETKRISLKQSSIEKLINGNSADVDKFSKDFKKIALDFQVINKRIHDYEETLQSIDRNGKTNSADINRINKEINGLLSRFELLQNDFEKHKAGGK